ncbi:DNA repair protein RecN [Muribaculaceae bacterium Isolate-039 (Harlan)]|nr:DNA repair protein RecN [Muribaculaceae bacterium Isolate-039 (Harlan)]ROS97727.1 DNA repair protein RecN [Muribaculaceae bacterium Isolate-077 (Janvier)]ROT00821.1 DNA repair protein RecN [Muribaculaceae bacterium Isolate-083 (Janvier)]ROT01241.1 DNA repair protein RecN [Muribaculaceae bacterium Isolate-084 (Janvier)]
MQDLLESLHISNYALIDLIDIDFHPGFNVITGETGAGKSIILGALSLLLGARADTRVVTDPETKSVIEAVFSVKDYPLLKEFCLQEDIEWDDDRCILRREISPAGRSRAFVNDSPVPLAKLREVSLHLIDIHSQHQNQLLSTPAFQLDVIDTLAGNSIRLKAYQVRFNALREAIKRLKTARARIERSREDEEFTRYQLEQIEELGLQRGEQAELERERDVMTNLASIKEALAKAMGALDGDNGGALRLVDKAIEACNELGDLLDASDAIPERLESAKIELADIASTFCVLDESLGADPAALASIEERLGAIYSLCHKHHVADADGLIDLRDSLREKLRALDSSDETLEELERDARRAKALAREAAQEISNARKEEAERFGRRLTEIAMPLGMKNLRCEISVTPADMTATGCDNVEFMVAFNKNQPLMPVGATASGGEISRLMLSIKSIIASRMQLPSIIFDEIDTGVSGDVANRMGQMMKDISENIQVTTITHLPQVASKGAHQYRVYKEDDEQSTHTRISLLSDEERVRSIAAMLGGADIDETAIAAARSLLAQR